MALPIHPHLLVLRTTATVLLSLLIAQVGWAAAFLGDSRRYFPYHVVTGFLLLAASVVGSVVYLVLRRSAGRVLVVMMLSVAVLVVVQVVLGELDVKALHIFLGVLTAMTGTALTSWTYRHQSPDRATGAATGSRQS